MKTIYTIGHSTHSFEDFLSLLRDRAIEAVADVRSAPFSRWQPHFNQDPIRQALAGNGIAYVPLGPELGGRGNSSTKRNERGRILYRSIAESREFRRGLDRLETGSDRMRIAIMCTEHDPLNCHRSILVSRALCADGLRVMHIHGDGRLESHRTAEHRLRRITGLEQPDLFRTEEQLLAAAYQRQEEKIAHVTQDAHGRRVSA